MSVKFVHFSDTHLGFSDLDKQNDEGINIREQDFYNSFRHIVNKIIEIRPAFAVHTGDLFHRTSPGNRTIVFAFNEIKRISAAGIPLYIIAGNHDYPKSIFTAPIHGIFDGDPNIKIFFNEHYETLETDNYILHALPHINEETRFKDECLKIKIMDRSKPNFLFMHLSVGRTYLMDEFGERIFPTELLPVLKEFDYVGLGHWHKFQHLQTYGNVFYTGSTERLSEKEASDKKGFAEVITDNKTEVKFYEIPVRIYGRVEINACYEKSKEIIIAELKEFNRITQAQSIISVLLNDLDPSQLFILSTKEINDIFPEALHVNISRTVINSSEVMISSDSSFDLKDQLNSELRKSFTDDKEYDKVQQLTMYLLSQLEEEEANAGL